MSEFENSMMMVRRILRVQFIGGAALIAAASVYYGIATGGWSGAVQFAGGAMVALSAAIWLMRLRTEALLKKVTIG